MNATATPITDAQIMDAQITDAKIVDAARKAKRRHYPDRSLDELLVDPVEFLHHSLDVACACGLDHAASARVRAAMTQALAKEPGARELIERIGKVIARAHEHGDLSLF